MVAIGVFLLAAALGRLTDMTTFMQPGTLAYFVIGSYLIWSGMRRLVATQLIVDPDRRIVVAKRWTISGADVQRIPFGAVTGFAIVPEGEEKKTSLVIQTTRGDVIGSGGMKGARAAWEEIIAAIDAHMNKPVGAEDGAK